MPYKHKVGGSNPSSTTRNKQGPHHGDLVVSWVIAWFVITHPITHPRGDRSPQGRVIILVVRDLRRHALRQVGQEVLGHKGHIPQDGRSDRRHRRGALDRSSGRALPGASRDLEAQEARIARLRRRPRPLT